MKKSVEKKASKKPVKTPVVVAPVVVEAPVTASKPMALNPTGGGLDIPSDRVITGIITSKGNPYATLASRHGMGSKDGQKYRAWELAKVGLSLGEWREACTKAGIPLYARSKKMLDTVQLGDPPPPPPPAPEPKGKGRKKK